MYFLLLLIVSLQQPEQKLKKSSCSMTFQIMEKTLGFTSIDYRHIRLSVGALWSVYSEWLLRNPFTCASISISLENSEPSKPYTASNELKMVPVSRNGNEMMPYVKFQNIPLCLQQIIKLGKDSSVS